ncbi:hypothetical protein [Paenisporosarcina sp. NPDC076898]|uniref:hypothetical protein n=1 Tax=unclassified Paenisporosarcina TaxID=2642018 RepID=UPI003D056BD4
MENKYTATVMNAITSYVEDINHINKMPKTEVMDLYIKSFGAAVKGKEVREVVQAVFGIDLNFISEKNYGNHLSQYQTAVMESLRRSLNVRSDSNEVDAQIMAMPKNEVMDRYIEIQDGSLSGAETRVLINQIFGVNLDGISGLEHSGISIRSKGQWILPADKKLFIVSSSLDDVELYVSLTEYFEETTGSNQLPDSLKKQLSQIGFTYDVEMNHCIYRNQINESVPDALKGQVMGIVLETIQSMKQQDDNKN